MLTFMDEGKWGGAVGLKNAPLLLRWSLTRGGLSFWLCGFLPLGARPHALEQRVPTLPRQAQRNPQIIRMLALKDVI
jgi:hypothetical protein